MKVHFIAIGGSAMHNLAIALHKKAYSITGSDDEIFEPSKSRLAKLNLLPPKEGWFPEKIHKELDAIILGMHAKADNPELIRAREMGLKIYSFPEFLYAQSKNKIRVVIGGSHGKTTITSMIMHVLKTCGADFDYLVGAKIKGFDVMVRLSDNAGIIILEGDEYLTSALDPRPKFHVYKANIGLISGISWDHMNVFPHFEDYLRQFRIFAGELPEGARLIYYKEDENIQKILPAAKLSTRKIPYNVPKYRIDNGMFVWIDKDQEIPLKIFGKHNMQNMMGAWQVCRELGISKKKFLQAIASFEGAANRLEKLAENKDSAVFKDFAHAPSKLKATTEAVKELYPHRHLVACMELHTYSSLNEAFLPQYENSMNLADTAIIYFNPHALQLKRLPELHTEKIKDYFNRNDLQVFNNKDKLRKYLLNIYWNKKNLLMMSSGSFDNMDLKQVADKITRS